MSPPLDPFDALGLEARFDLTSPEIERAYLARAGTLHPDRSTGDAAAASTLNRARQTLKDPMARAEALLARLGGPGPSQDKTLPPNFLGEILEVREQLEAALATGDSGERARWEDWAERRRREHIEAIAGRLRGYPPTLPTVEALAGVRRELNVWRYTERVLEQLSGTEGSAGR